MRHIDERKVFKKQLHIYTVYILKVYIGIILLLRGSLYIWVRLILEESKEKFQGDFLY